MLKVLIVGQTPPPFNGQALMIERLVNSELADVELIHVRMGFSANMYEMGHIRLSKVFHLFGLVARIIYNRFAHDVHVLYYPPAGPDRVPVLRDIIILLTTRWLFDRTILHFHCGGISELYERMPRWQRWFFRRAYFGADAAIRLSEFNVDDGRRLGAKRNYVIPNGIDDPCLELPTVRANGAVPHDDCLRILFVGVLSEAKGISVLIEACAKLAARGIPFELELMGQWGTDEFAERARRRIDELNLGGHVRLLGQLIGADKWEVYQRADIFCLPTLFDTLPVVLLEAMAFKLPIVATSIGGIPAIVDEGESGFLAPPEDPDALADRLARLAQDPHLRDSMGLAGRAKFEREYTLPRHVSHMREVLLETAGVASDTVREVDRGTYAQQLSGPLATECGSEAGAETVTV